MALERPAPDVDVVVVGSGNAGLIAALAARERGSRVLLLEAGGFEARGGNSRFASGVFRVAHNGLDDLAPLLCDEARAHVHRVSLGDYPAERYRADLVRVTGGDFDEQLVAAMISQSLETCAWMRDRRVPWSLTFGKLFDPDNLAEDEIVDLPAGGELIVRGGGIALTDALIESAEEAGVVIRYESPVHDLLTSGDTVRGVQVRRRDELVEVAAGATVLACGGFEASAEMRLRYLGPGWDLVKVRGTPLNTGHMLTRAIDAGAQATGNWSGAHASPVDADSPAAGDPDMGDATARYSYPYGLLVNMKGERFFDEGADEVWFTYSDVGWAIREQPQGRAVQIFDQKAMHLLEPRYATGTPIQADTLGDLAAALGLPAPALEDTVARFNAACPGGRFTPFAKDGLGTSEGLEPPKSNWAVPLDKPPYAAYPVTCGITFTFGGLAVDTSARVLSQQGKPMPGLFAAGEIAGGFFAHNVPSGAGLTKGAVFGRIAGEAAASYSGLMWPQLSSRSKP